MYRPKTQSAAVEGTIFRCILAAGLVMLLLIYTIVVTVGIQSNNRRSVRRTKRIGDCDSFTIEEAKVMLLNERSEDVVRDLKAVQIDRNEFARLSYCLRNTTYPGVEAYRRYSMVRLGLTGPREDIAPIWPGLEPVVNNVTFTYLIQPTKLCQARDLMVIIFSRPERADQRQLLRNSWLKTLTTDSKVNYAFFMASVSSNVELEKQIIEESLIYGDVIQVKELEDYGHNNRTLETVALLHWAHTYCTDVDVRDPLPFVLKCDDDVYVNVPNLMEVVGALDRDEERVYGTRFEMEVFRSEVSFEIWPWSSFPTNHLILPGAFLMTGSALTFLLAAAQTTPYFFLDDVYFSGLICSRESTIQVLVSDRFDCYTNTTASCSHGIESYIKNAFEFYQLYRMMIQDTPDEPDFCFIRDSITWKTWAPEQLMAYHKDVENYHRNNSHSLSCNLMNSNINRFQLIN